MFQVNNIYHGFRLIEESRIEEMDSIGRVFEHVKSGARLLHLENSDDNKFFTITFRTTPKDNTGAGHIVEHSILHGSKKFKVKDIFNDMAKGSMKTFLDAMTFPDKTMYPISSRNHRDFFNLMEVYLDAVFYPNIYENMELLRQEGWRYEIDEETNKLIYKGIVYSEMQGALSTSERIIKMNIMSSLFPNTTYAFNSGGNPEDIPNLTQEDFENFYSKFYHPSNSYIYLYGNQDLDECLRLINEEYLKNFHRIEVTSNIDEVKPFDKMVEKIVEYSIDEDEDNNTFMALSFSCGETKDREMYLPMKIVNNMIIESAASPIKKALLEKKIGEDILSYDDLDMDPIKKNICSIVVSNTSEDKKDEFKEVVFDTFKTMVSNGIDRKLIEASINSIEFDLREADPWEIANRGIGTSFSVMESWLYDGDPLEHLRYEEKLKEIKRDVENNYFEKFIEKNLINNNHCSLVVVKPKKGLGEDKAKMLEEKLEKYKESLSESDIKAIKERNKKLKEAQMRGNTKEELATLPKLSLSEVSKYIEKSSQKIIEKDGVKVLINDVNTNKIAYINLLFNANVIEEKDVPYLALLRDMLCNLNVKGKAYDELVTDIFRKTGGISFKTEVYKDFKDNEKYKSKFNIKSKVLCDNIKDLLQLINEVITSTEFNDMDRIKEVVQEIKGNLKRSVVSEGHELAMSRSASHFSKKNKYRDMVNGYMYYEFICDIEDNFEEKCHEIQASLVKVYERIFNKNNLIVSYTGDTSYVDDIVENLNIALKNLSDKRFEESYISFNSTSNVEAMIIPSKVQYVVKAFNYNKLGYEYSGKMRVLKNILESDYLYPRVRLQGGAYLCYMNLKDDGTICFYSYRDPNLSSTIKTYDDAGPFLETINYSSKDMESFIIGAVGELDKPLTLEEKSDKAIKNYICGVSNEDMQRERDELLNTSLQDVKDFEEMIKSGMKENYCCVLGNEKKIRENKDVFCRVTSL